MQEITYKNKQLKDAAMLDFRIKQLPEAEHGKKISSMTTEQRGLQFQHSYITSLLEVAAFPEVHLTLNLTYETVCNLVAAVGYEFSVQRGTYDTNTNINILEKSIAAYLTWLAANEHGLKIEVTEKQYTNVFQVQKESSWIGCDIKICSPMVKEDFLDAIHGQITVAGKKLTIRMRNIISSYKRVTAHDLAADGVEDTQMIIS